LVTGGQTFAAGSLYDAEALGTASDRIVFTGALSVDPAATLRLTGTSPVGTRHTLLQGGTVSAGQTFGPGQTFTAKDGDAEAPLAFILDTVAGSAGRVDAIIVRGSIAGEASTPLVAPTAVAGASPAFLARLADLARVEVDPVTGEVTDLTQGPLGDQLASLSDAAAPAAIKSLTGVAYLSGLGMAHLSAAADNEALARRTEQRRYDRGYMSVKSREFFVSATSGSWNSDDSPAAPGYDISRTGMLVGWDRDFGPEAVGGLALSLDRSEAKLGGGGTVEAVQARVHAFGSVILADEATFLEGGAWLGHSSQDANRGVFAGGVTSSPSAWTAGGWVRFGRAGLLAPRTSVAPFVQLDVSHVSQGGFEESGPADSQTKLKVEDVSQTDVRGRLGASLAQSWDSDSGGWRYRLSLDLAYVVDLSGGEITTEASNSAPNGVGQVSASANPLDRGGLLVTPAFTFGPDHDTSFGVSAEFRQLDGGDATSINLTYRRRF
jgi:outer membrane autotransporter protein